VIDEATVVDPAAVLYGEALLNGGDAGAAAAASSGLPSEMIAFLAAGPGALGLATEALSTADSRRTSGDPLYGPDGRAAVQPLESVRLLAPVPRPRRIRDYLTYIGHATGSGMKTPAAFTQMPICYKGNVETVVGPDDPLLWPSYTERLDYELEIGFYTSGGGRDLSVTEAQKIIGGITIFNDVSARDIQITEMSLGLGPSKGKDFCSAMGPCVLTMDEVDEWSIAVEARVNGQVWSSGTTKDRQFSFAEVLAWASLDEEVYPGEFLALGTVGGGCGLELDRWIQPGDIVELEAAGVGTLRNPVGPRQALPAGAGLASYPGPTAPGADR